MSCLKNLRPSSKLKAPYSCPKSRESGKSGKIGMKCVSWKTWKSQNESNIIFVCIYYLKECFLR